MSRSVVGLKSIALDVVAGLLAFSLVFLWLILYACNDLRLFALITAALFFFAGAFRATELSRKAALKVLLIGFGGIVPVVVMRLTGFAFTAYGYVPLFVTFSLLMTAAGIGMRCLFARGHRSSAVLSAVLSLGGATLATIVAIPPLVAHWSNEGVNRLVPAFSLSLPDGKTVNSGDLRGRVVVLAFWATWCTPCRQELPELQEVYASYESRSGVTFYAVGGPWGEDTLAKESAFAASLNLILPLAFDSQGAAKVLGVRGFPALIILDPDGHVRLFHNGYDASEHFSRQVATQVATLERKQQN
jgi:peroxiredoxin